MFLLEFLEILKHRFIYNNHAMLTFFIFSNDKLFFKRSLIIDKKNMATDIMPWFISIFWRIFIFYKERMFSNHFRGIFVYVNTWLNYSLIIIEWLAVHDVLTLLRCYYCTMSAQSNSSWTTRQLSVSRIHFFKIRL